MSSVAAEHIVGYSFTRQDLLTEALDTSGDRTPESNQRLAMLGDALLQIILLDAWYASGNTKGTLVTSYLTMSWDPRLLILNRSGQQCPFHNR
jgi:dsRNA-specific ribonuclease